MHLSFIRFYWLRLFGALTALTLALLYLAGFELTGLAGFSCIGAIAVYIGIRINNETMPARCDLCGATGTMKAEYGTGFVNARLILICPYCGRVVNSSPGSVKPQKE
jgi:hypothetical protein